MLRSLLLILVGVGGIVMDDASSSLYAQNSYPRVYGPTGRPYGPTQAHYQYERQYGRPWPGGPAQFDPNTGANFQVTVPNWGLPGFGFYGGIFPGGNFYGGNVPYYGYGYGYQQQGALIPGGVPRFNGYSIYQNQYGYGPIQQYQVAPQPIIPQFGPAPTFSWQQPDALQQFGIRQPRRVDPQPQPALAPPNGAVEPVVGAAEPVMQRPHQFMPAPPSTVAQRQKSLHLQGQGDIWFRQLNYLQAYSRYKQAAAAAPDLAAPRFRMAYALMALRRFELAVPELQRGIKLDPRYPTTGESPQEVYGEENRIAAAALPQSVAAWVRQDIRSPDRLFLLGALLMMSGDAVRARTLLETAAEFGGPNEAVIAFLRADQVGPNVPASVPSEDERPPVPEAVEKLLNENNNWLPPKQKPSKVAPLQGPPELPRAAPESVKPAPQDVEPPADITTAPPPKPNPAVPGYQPIPKKDSDETPETPSEQPADGKVEPTGGEVPVENGPEIPLPNSGPSGN